MARYSTCPTLFDDCKSLSISDLIKWDYLKPNTFKSGVVTWSRNGVKTSSIGINVSTVDNNYLLTLDYTINKQPINYTVDIRAIPSNLGKGDVLYFVCPATHKLCRKLYLVDRRFLHREAFTGCLYQSQAYSSKIRSQVRLWSKAFVPDEVYRELHSKHFKNFYAGKPTKRFMRLTDKLKVASRYSQLDIERMMLAW